MLLSIQQKYILKVLRKLGCIRRRQLTVLVCEKFRRPDMEISEARLEAMLRQLRFGSGNIRIAGEIISQSNVQPDFLRLEAVDVMLELTEGVPEDFSICLEPPGLLRFSWGSDLRLFTVAALSTPVRPTVEALLQQRRVIWITSSGTAPEGLTLPPEDASAELPEDGEAVELNEGAQLEKTLMPNTDAPVNPVEFSENIGGDGSAEPHWTRLPLLCPWRKVLSRNLFPLRRIPRYHLSPTAQERPLELL